MCVLVIALARLGGIARGDDNAALAERLFIEGRRLVDAGEVEKACDKFSESLRLDAALGTLLNVAECETRLGRTASAWAHFRELRERAGRAGQKDRESYARDKLAELEPKLGFARLDLPTDRPIDRVEIDRRELGAASLSTDLPLDPGRHLAIVMSAGARYELPFDIPSAPGTFVVHVVLDEPHRVTSRPMSPPVPPGPRPIDGRKVAGWTSLGLSLIAGSVGGYLGARAISLHDSSEKHCDARGCDPTGLDQFRRARAHANGATAAFIVSGVTLATGTGLLVWVATDKAPAASVAVVGRF